MRCLLFLALSLSLLSCNNDDDNKPDCSLIDCAATEWYLDLTSSTTGENLFENNSLNKENISVVSTITDKHVDFLVFNGLLILPFGNYTGNFSEVSYEVKNNDQILFTLTFEAKLEIPENQCCPDASVRNVSFDNAQTEKSDKTKYTVILNL
ncbi:MAG: hypothetical protein COA80_03620 [Leeuwenhoekiella sp.]|nr:MAG: hypothetical protein COA80_03620 [Leeuwenhoekiella sp.]